MGKTNAINIGIGGIKGGMPNNIPTGIDWTKADLRTTDGRKETAAAISEYLKEVRANDPYYGIKNTRTGHLDLLPSPDMIDVNFYRGRMANNIFDVFRYVDKRQSKNPTYKFASVNAESIVFRQKVEGREARIERVNAATPGSIESVTWEGGIGIDDELLRFDDYGIFEQNVQAIPTAWMNKWSTNLVALFTALGSGINQTWDTNLIKTVNAACQKILDDAGDTYGLSDTETFYLMHNGANSETVVQALVSSFQLANDNNSGNQLVHNVVPMQNRRLAAGVVYVALPGHDMVDAEWDEAYTEEARNPHAGSNDIIVRSRRNAAIGNTQQVRRITLQ